MNAEVSIVSFARPNGPITPIGLLMFDTFRQQLRVRFRQNWLAVADEDDVEVLSNLADGILQTAREMGAQKFLTHLESSCSWALQVSAREHIQSENLDVALEDLYRRYVDPAS
jgi:hypothetical protein